MNKNFGYGFVCCIFVINTIQDFYGKAKYLKFMDETWTNFYWPVSAAIVALLLYLGGQEEFTESDGKEPWRDHL